MITSTGVCEAVRVDLAVRVEDALDELPDAGRREVLGTIATVLVRRDVWPTLGSWEAAVWFGRRCWVVFAAYPDGIDVLDLGWAG
ncbi:hypothetical protein [Streptomyces sp. S.PNR 29]|uniref:hypothetical protein n=1 Tax=Streptomyces sp. S.PNR 29 TaxID=2973805 RepID=UPI0025B27099|nr:hypothetical protein [Streptomyces sp. S.PNR 29]MDN0199403.1 hypothetical protein [Streptomyces sp. S.PNR 29]